MKQQIILWIGALLLLTAGAGCEKKSSEEESRISCPCECVEEKIPITTLKNESARIRYKKLDNHVSFVLDNKELVHEHYLILLGCDMAPHGCDIPEKYKEDGLPVIISGEVFDCSEYIKPWIKRAPVYFIKLSTIKKSHRYVRNVYPIRSERHLGRLRTRFRYVPNRIKYSSEPYLVAP